MALASLATIAAGTLAATGSVGAAPAAAIAKTPDTAKLAGALAKQTLTWEKCDFGDSSLNARFADLPNVRCATVKVPRDWHDPGNGKTWDIRISQAKNREVTDVRYAGTMFVNPGGPGGEGLPWGAAMQERSPDLAPYYNFVGFDPRGVGQSSASPCEYTYDLLDTDPDAAAKAAAAACSQDPDTKTINTEQTAYDMDFVRHLLKAPKLSYTGYSYGTWLGAWYSNVFGANADRMVLDSSTDVTLPTLQKTWEVQNVARDRQFSMHLMNWIARHNDTYGLGTDPQKIRSNYFAAIERMKANDPQWQLSLVLTWVFGGIGGFSDNSQYPAAAATVQELSSRFSETVEDPDLRPSELLASVQKAPGLTKEQRRTIGKAVTAAKELEALPTTESQAKTAAEEDDEEEEPSLPYTQPIGAFDAIRCNDGQWTQGVNYWNQRAEKERRTVPFSNTLGLSATPACAFWRTSNLMPVADPTTYPKTIVIQAEMDSQTAWETGYTSGTQLPNTAFVAIDNEGSHGEFPYGSECVDRPVVTFFLKGKLPSKDIKVCGALPLPEDSTTYQSWSRLNNKAKHTGAVVSSPWVPAAEPKRTGAALSLVPEDEALAAEAKALIAQAYGQRGIKVARGHGLVD